MREHMKTCYYAGITQSQDTIKRFSRTRYNIFRTKEKIIIIIVAIALAVGGIFTVQHSKAVALVLMFLGCVIFANLDAPADYTANQVISMFHNDYPILTYIFSPTFFLVQNSEEEISYKKIIKLIEDSDFIYIFLSEQYGIMIKSSSVHGENGLDGFKEFLCKKTNLKWEKQPSFFSFRISKILENRGILFDTLKTNNRLKNNKKE